MPTRPLFGVTTPFLDPTAARRQFLASSGRAMAAASSSDRKLGKPVSYLNDANAAALWGHYAIFGSNSRETSISSVIGTGNGGGVILRSEARKTGLLFERCQRGRSLGSLRHFWIQQPRDVNF